MTQLAFPRVLKGISLYLTSPAFIELFNTVFVRFLILVLNFTATTLITRHLSVEDRGQYAILLNLIYLVMTFFSFGFHSSIVYFLSRKHSLFSTFYMISLGLVLSSTFLLTLFSLLGVFNFFFPNLNDTDNIILLFGAPFVLFSYFTSFFFLSVNDFNKYNAMEFIKTFTFLLLVILSYGFILGYSTYILYFIIGNIIHIALSLFYFIKLGYIKRDDLNIRRNISKYVEQIKSSFDVSLISNTSCILSFLLGKYILFFIGSQFDVGMMNKEDLGYYSVALANIDIVSILPATLAFYIFPKVSATECQKTKIDIAKNMIIICLLFFVCVGLVSFFFLNDVFRLLYGSTYETAAPMFMYLLPSALFLSIISCISSYIGGIGMERTAILAPLWGFLFMLVSSFYLMYSSFDVYNFIYVQNVAYLIYLLIYIRFFLKKWKESKKC